MKAKKRKRPRNTAKTRKSTFEMPSKAKGSLTVGTKKPRRKQTGKGKMRGGLINLANPNRKIPYRVHAHPLATTTMHRAFLMRMRTKAFTPTIHLPAQIRNDLPGLVRLRPLLRTVRPPCLSMRLKYRHLLLRETYRTRSRPRWQNGTLGSNASIISKRAHRARVADPGGARGSWIPN